MRRITKHIKTEFIKHLPALLGKPLQLMPFIIQKKLLTLVLQKIFKKALDNGDIDFLGGFYIRFEIKDSGLHWTYTFKDNSFEMVYDKKADTIITSNLRDFILLANQRVDPDTLFFQRRLIIEGNTELGLTMKNLLDALDPASLPIPMVKGLRLMEIILID